MEKGIKCTYSTKFDTLFEQNQQVSLRDIVIELL